MKSTAKAPANIAFIKYWGKRDEELRIPLNASISMNLSGAYTVTTVEFSTELKADSVTLLDGEFSPKEIERVIRGLDRIRERAGRAEKAKVITKNTFPKGAGSAASASGFAALTVAAFSALEVSLSEKELTVFARMGSGSACRSIPDGFVKWDDESAFTLYPHDYWDLRDILVIVDSRMKKVSTTEGMETITTSPLLQARLSAIPARLKKCETALQEKDFKALGEVIEEDCLDMHRVMQTQVPSLYYWNEVTVKIMELIQKRSRPAYFTIDAGPNVHLICEGEDEMRVLDVIRTIDGIENSIRNHVSEGAKIIKDHLF